MKNVPKLRFSGFSDEWEEKKIGDFLTESRIPGSNGSIAKKLTVKLWAKGVVPKSEAYEGSDNTKYYIRKAGQLIYGKLDFLNCAFGIIPEELDGYESTLDAPAFDIKNIDSKFIYSRIIQKDFYKKNGETANGSRKAKRIHADVFLDMDIKVPSKEEQEKIAKFLTKVDKLIEKQEEKISNLEQYKKGMMQKIFSQEIRFKKEDGGEYPKWKEKLLGEVSDVRDGTHDSPQYLDEGYPLITSKNLNSSGKLDIENVNYISAVDFESINKRSKVDVGDILFGMIGTIGNPVLVNIDNFAIKNVALIKEKEILKNRYLIHYLNSDDINKQFYKTNAGGTQKFIALNLIRTLTIYIPCLEEQTKIANFLSKIDSIVEKEKEKLEELRVWKKGLLQGMFV